MIIKGIDLGLSTDLTGEVNPLKKNIKILNKQQKKFKKIYGFPSSKSTFRKYTFPFKDRSKIEKAVKTQIQLDFPLNLDEIEYAYYVKYDKNGSDVFCVIAKREDIEVIKDGDIIDSEVFALLRLAKYNGLSNCEIYHFSEDYSVFLNISDGEIVEVKVLNKETEIYGDPYLSGKIPDKYSNRKILSNPTNDPVKNVSFGLLLRGLDDTGIDFLHRSEEALTEKLLKGALYLALAVVILNLALLFRIYILEKQLKKIKEEEKVLFVKGFNYTGEVFDPLEQAKGKLSVIRKGSIQTEDSVDILDFIGKSKKDLNISYLYKINITKERFTIHGTAESIKDVEAFKNNLAKKYNATIGETVTTPEGKVRFSITGAVK
ncbi:hypothetical protein [Persephonella sp.]